MENTNFISQIRINKLVAETYVCKRDILLYYVMKRINNYEDARDITHDVFLRMMEYGGTLGRDSVNNFMFTVAHNLVIDYLRYYRNKQAVDINSVEGLYDRDCADGKVVTDDLARLEMKKVMSLSEQRKVVYMKNRYEDKTPGEIAKELSISKRTVEGHLFLGRRQVREYIKQCI